MKRHNFGRTAVTLGWGGLDESPSQNQWKSKVYAKRSGGGLSILASSLVPTKSVAHYKELP